MFLGMYKLLNSWFMSLFDIVYIDENDVSNNHNNYCTISSKPSKEIRTVPLSGTTKLQQDCQCHTVHAVLGTSTIDSSIENWASTADKYFKRTI